MDTGGSRLFTVLVNGAPHQVRDGTTVGDLLDRLAVDRRRVAVEYNRTVLPRDEVPTTPLAPGDRIELVEFVGGG